MDSNEVLKTLSSVRNYLSFLRENRIEYFPVKQEDKSAHPGDIQMKEDDKSARLGELYKQVEGCAKCGLSGSRTNVVFGEGSCDARLVFVGEAPGRNEDEQGIPFVGRAGELLTKIINAMGLTREDVYICNVIKCRPPGNRDPNDKEIGACEPFLIKQLEIIEPEMICALGRYAAQTLLRSTTAISKMRGNIYLYNNIKLMPTFHPAALLRNPNLKRDVWNDMQKIMKEIKN